MVHKHCSGLVRLTSVQDLRCSTHVQPPCAAPNESIEADCCIIEEVESFVISVMSLIDRAMQMQQQELGYQQRGVNGGK